MNAVKCEVIIGTDRRIVIDLPPETPEGPAEVIVLVPENSGSSVDSLLDGIAEWRRAHPAIRRSKADIDRELAFERASWEGHE